MQLCWAAFRIYISIIDAGHYNADALSHHQGSPALSAASRPTVRFRCRILCCIILAIPTYEAARYEALEVKHSDDIGIIDANLGIRAKLKHNHPLH